MNINRFMAAHVDNMVRQNKFEVEIFGPAGIRSRGLRCTNINIPGKQIVFAEMSEYGGGPMRKHPNKVDYGGGVVTMQFMCDHTFEDKQTFELWQQYIHDEAYGFQYQDDYTGTVKIRQMGQDNLAVYEVELHEAFPQNIQEQTLDASASDIQTFTVSVAFRSWSSSFENSPAGLLGGLFNKFKRKIKSKVKTKVEDKLFGRL